MAAFLPVAVLLSLPVTGTMAGSYYGSQTTPSTSTPASYSPTTTTPSPPPPPPTSSQRATPPKPAHGYDDDDNNKLVAVVRVVVEGLVLCQSCAQRGLDNPAPLPKAQVMVTCRDTKDSVLALQLSVADSNGYFYAELSVKRADPSMACFVRLHKSPDPKCDMVSEIHLRDEGKRLIDGHGFRKVVYAAHPLAFRPQKCALPHHY